MMKKKKEGLSNFYFDKPSLLYLRQMIYLNNKGTNSVRYIRQFFQIWPPEVSI